jgi:Lrp/AsnC family transcriptional regulator, regulator for asnA, asnC and gidA
MFLYQIGLIEQKMLSNVDEKDRKILDVLKENSRLSSHKISKKTLIPITTVNNRIKKMQRKGIIKRYTVDLDMKKLGYEIAGYIFVQISLEELKRKNMKTRNLIMGIKKHPLVYYAENLTGDMDLLVKVYAKDINELNEYVVGTLSAMQGVEKTRTSIILEHK